MWSKKKNLFNPAGELFSESGFTLLEVVVALAILSGALVSLLVLHQHNLADFRNAASLSRATFLAREYLAGITTGENASEPGETEGSFPQEAGDVYRWRREIEPTDAEGLLRVHLKVLWGEEKRGEFVEFTTYVAAKS